MATDAAGEISELVSKLASVEAVLNPDAMRKEADGLRDRSADPELWADQDQAQAVTRRLSYLEGELARLATLKGRLDDVAVMFELAEEWKIRPKGSNPCRGLKHYTENRVERFLSADEFSRLGAALVAAESGRLTINEAALALLCSAMRSGKRSMAAVRMSSASPSRSTTTLSKFSACWRTLGRNNLSSWRGCRVGRSQRPA